MNKPLVECDVTFYGINHSDYFQGHGTAFTEFTRCVTGVGDTASEALADAIDGMAQTASFDLDAVRLPMLGAAKKEAAGDTISATDEERKEYRFDLEAGFTAEDGTIDEDGLEAAIDAGMEGGFDCYYFVGLSWIDPEDHADDPDMRAFDEGQKAAGRLIARG